MNENLCGANAPQFACLMLFDVIAIQAMCYRGSSTSKLDGLSIADDGASL
jgi:hypothetical protein